MNLPRRRILRRSRHRLKTDDANTCWLLSAPGWKPSSRTWLVG